MPNSKLAISSLQDFVYAKAPRPVTTKRGLVIGGGTAIPEVNFTLPPMDINEQTWPEICRQYQEIISSVCQRAVELEVPGLLIEFETLPPMTTKPAWGAEITKILSDCLQTYYDKHKLKGALRLTPNDNRDHNRPPLMRKGFYWDGMVELFNLAGKNGADFLAIESTGGKEVCDEGIIQADLRAMIFALGILAPKDMKFLWGEIVGICKKTGVIPSGDTACGFANTAMVLAEKKFIPKVFAAVVRVASVVRSLVAYEAGAVGPSKDCAYEGPYMKAIAGVPISMEGRSAACAHLSSVGNIAQAVCDCWSNESVQNVRLLSAYAPVVSLEQLAYDCRLMNHAASKSADDARKLRDWLTDTDSFDPQAYVLRPDVVLRISAEIIKETDPYLRTCRGARAAIQEIQKGAKEGVVKLEPREKTWLDRLAREAEDLPETEAKMLEEMKTTPEWSKFLPEEYGISK